MKKKLSYYFILLLFFPFIYWALINAAIDLIANISNNNIQPANNFNAATLALQTSPNSGFSAFLTPENPVSRQITITANPNDAKPQYSIVAANLKGRLCPYLKLTAYLNKKIKFNGPLAEFSQTLLLGTKPNIWQFILSLDNPADNLENQSCDFAFNFFADENNQPQQIKNHIRARAGQKDKNQAQAGDVIINEIMPAPAKAYYNDGWLELKNNTNYNFDLGGWTLTGVLAGQKNLRLPAKTILPAQGYFLLARYYTADSRCLRNIDADLIVGALRLNTASTAPIALLDASGNLIDKVNWPAQTKPFYSWQRNYFSPSTVSFQPAWSLCQNKLAQLQIFWQKPNIACGTPKAKNLTAQPTASQIIQRPLFYASAKALDKQPTAAHNQKGQNKTGATEKTAKIKPVKITTASSTTRPNLSKIKIIPLR